MNELELIAINKFQELFNVDLENDEILTLNNVKIVNFYNRRLTFIHSLRDYEGFEFCHSLNKIFGKEDFINNNLSYYETEKINIQPNDIVFDCGGNYGLFAAVAATKSAQVYSFEPMSLIRTYLAETKKLYNNMIIVPYGLSNVNTTSIFLQCDNPAASRQNNLIELNETNQILYHEQVRLMSIDRFIQEYKIFPTFIKADVEGGEIELILGAEEYIKNCHPKISISIHHNNLNKLSMLNNFFNQYQYELFIKEDKHTSYEKTEDILLLGERNVNIR